MRIAFTVATTTRRVAYAGNGVTTNFAVPFQFFASTDLRVISVSSTGVETTLTLNVNYTVTGGEVAQQPGSGFVIATVAPATGVTWVIEGAASGAQTADYQQNDAFPAETNEEALDRATIVAQEAVLRAKQGPKLPATYDPSALPPRLLPLPVPGTFVGGAANGLDWANFPASSVPANADSVFFNAPGGPARSVEDRLLEWISVKDFGATGNGVDDDTAYLTLAAVAGAGKTIVFPPGRYITSGMVLSGAGTRLLALGDATIVSKAASTGATVRAWIDDFVCEGLKFEALNSPSLTALLWVDGHRYRVEHCRFTGQPVSFRTYTTVPGPNYGLLVSTQSSGTAYFMREDGYVNHVYTTGGQTGVFIQGGKRLNVSNVTSFMHSSFGVIIGGGLAATDVRVHNVSALCCGQYGFSNSAQFGAAGIEPVPFSGWRISNGYSENCGWGAYFSGVNGAVGSGKFGFDITDDGFNGLQMKAAAKNCSIGGMETKGARAAAFGYDVVKTTTAETTSGSTLPFASTTNVYVGMSVSGTNIPSDTYIASKTSTTVTLTRAISGTVANGASITFTVNIQPSGHRDIDIDFQYISWLDFSQSGVGVFLEDTGAATTFAANQNIKCFAVTEQAPTWRSSHPYKPFDIVVAGGYAWMCMGKTTDGQPGTSGQSIPTGSYVHHSKTTNSATASGDTLHFASTTDIQTGMRVWGTNIPDDTSVIAVGANDVQLNKNVTGSGVANGARVIIAALWSDGSLYWVGMGADASAASTLNIGVNMNTVQNVTVDVTSIGNSRGLYINAAGGTDNTVRGLKVKAAKIRGALYGITLNGTGPITAATFAGLDVEASSIGFYHALTGGTHSYDILDGRVAAAGNNYAYRIDGGTNTIGLNGLFVSGGRAVLVNGGTNTIRCGSPEFVGATSVGVVVVDIAAGSGTWDWGNSIIFNGNTLAGYAISGGTMTSRGRVLRQDLTVAPTTEAANVGEYMTLAAAEVTATEWGYFCTASATWHPMPLT